MENSSTRSGIGSKTIKASGRANSNVDSSNLDEAGKTFLEGAIALLKCGMVTTP